MVMIFLKQITIYINITRHQRSIVQNKRYQTVKIAPMLQDQNSSTIRTKTKITNEKLRAPEGITS